MTKIIFLLILTLLTSGCAGLGLIAVGAIFYSSDNKEEVASVNIKSTPNAIYDVALKLIKANPKIFITNQDDDELTLELAKEGLTGTLIVEEDSATISTLTITSSLPDEEKTALFAVLKICEELKVKCEIHD